MNILIVADSTDYWCAAQSRPMLLRYITSATGYTFRVVPILLFMLIAIHLNKKMTVILSIPALANGLLAYGSVFNKLMFYFDENNKFHRGVLGFVPFLVSAFYMLMLLIGSIRKYRMGDKKECSVVFFIAFMSTVAVCIETFLHMKFIINGVGGISIVFYYLFMHTQTYKRDALTNALNRHSFYTDTKVMRKLPMVIVSIDINNLKLINDSKGHSFGDKAICTVTEIIYKNINSNFQLYRMGGDEFTILCPKANTHSIEKIMNLIYDETYKKGYQIAWGMAKYKPDMDFEKACSLSDARMYENKFITKNTLKK
ncbi:MAG: GGDEF domain-containing protein [Hominimerdicola sp.]